MKDLNLCQFIGRLGSDPEVKYMPSGTAVANFSIACNDDYKDKETGEEVKRTEWVRIVIFGKLADVAGQYLKKGSQVYVSGKMTTRKWQDKSGVDRYTTEVNVNNMQMLGTSRASTTADAQHTDENRTPSGGGEPDFNDSIPF